MIRTRRSRPASRLPPSPRAPGAPDRDASSSRPRARPSPQPPHSIGQRLARLPRRRRAAARDRPDLAGDAAQPQPPLGQPGDDRLHRGPEPHRDQGRLEGPLRRRHRPGARRAGRAATPATRPGSTPTSGSPRRPARPQPRRARAALGDQRARRRPAPRQRQLDALARSTSSRRPRATRGSSASSSPRRSSSRSAPRRGRGDAAWLRKIRPWWDHDRPFPRPPELPAGARRAASTRTPSRPATAARTRSGG